jgi:hypothetical protein
VPVTISELHTDVVTDASTGSATDQAVPAPPLSVEKWRELHDCARRDDCRTAAIDFED